MFPRGPSSKTINEFESLMKSAESQYNRNRCDMAINLASKAVRLVDQNFGPTEKPGALRFLADCYKKEKHYDKSMRSLQEAIDLLKKSQKGQRGEAAELILMELHNCCTNLGLEQIDEIERQVKEETTDIPQRVFQLLETSKKNLLDAFSVSTNGINAAKNQLRSERQPSYNDWFEFYCSDLLNIVNVYLLESELFEQEISSRRIIALVNRVQRFYNEHSSQFKLKSVLSKCYYSMGLAYRFLKDYPEAEKYFKKDNNYCRKHHLAEQLRQNRDEMMKLYILMQQYEKALQYSDENTRSGVEALIQRSKEVKRMLNHYDTGVFDWNGYGNLAAGLAELEFLNPLINVSEEMLRLHRHQMSQQRQFDTLYNIADAYYRQQQLDKCQEYLDQCSRLCLKQSKQGVRAATLRLNMLSDNPKSDQLKVTNSFKQWIAVARSINEADLRKVLQDNFNLYRSQVRFRKMEDQDVSDDEDIHQRFAVRHEQDRSGVSDEVHIVEDVAFDHQNNFKKVSNTSARLVGEAYYRSKCLKYKLKANSYAIKNIINRRPHDVAGLANFSEKHLMILLKTVGRPRVLDLRSHQLSNQFLQELNRQIAKKKVWLDELDELAIDSRISDALALSRTVQYCINLKQLRLRNCSVPQLFSMDYELLTVLKLKACRIDDESILSFPFSEMKSLKHLSLSQNQLTAGSFEALNRLQLLKSLNLSSNPLAESGRTGRSLSPVVLTLKLHNIAFSTELVNLLFDVLRGSKELDISGCITPKLFFEAMFSRYISQHYQLDVEELRLNSLTLSEQLLGFVKSFIVSSHQLTRVELRDIRHSSTLLADLATFIHDNSSSATVDLRSSDVLAGAVPNGQRILL